MSLIHGLCTHCKHNLESVQAKDNENCSGCEWMTFGDRDGWEAIV